MSVGVPLNFLGFDPEHTFTPLRKLNLASKSITGKTFDEAFLQRMIHEAPEVIPVQEYFSTSKQVISLGREIPVDVGGGKVRSLDNLLVTTDGRLVFVEAKLWRNPEALRHVVAQALEYARALTSVKLSELEHAIRSCAHADRVLQGDQSIEDYLAALNESEALDGYDPNTFGSELERNLRTGEVLLLILGDGIHPSVERFVDWFERRAAMPLNFGLVQIQVFQNTDSAKYLAVPQTLLKTRELTRHVVVVDIQAPQGVTAEATVVSATGDAGTPPRIAGKSRASAESIITWSELLAQIRDNSPSLEDEIEVFAQGLEGLGLVPLPTKTAIAYAAYVENEKQPIRMISILEDKVYAGWISAALKNVGLDAEIAVNYRKDLNSIAPFWREVGEPGAVEDKAGAGVSLVDLKGKFDSLLEVVRKYTAIIRDTSQPN